MNGKHCAKHVCLTNITLKNHVRVIKVHNLPQNRPMNSFRNVELGCDANVQAPWLILNHIGLPFLNAQKCGKFKNVGKDACGKPTMLTIIKGEESS